MYFNQLAGQRHRAERRCPQECGRESHGQARTRVGVVKIITIFFLSSKHNHFSHVIKYLLDVVRGDTERWCIQSLVTALRFSLRNPHIDAEQAQVAGAVRMSKDR